jgi:hypothetical protein
VYANKNHCACLKKKEEKGKKTEQPAMPKPTTAHPYTYTSRCVKISSSGIGYTALKNTALVLLA